MLESSHIQPVISLLYKNLLRLIERNLFVDRAFGSVSRLPSEVPMARANGLCSEDLLNSTSCWSVRLTNAYSI